MVLAGADKWRCLVNRVIVSMRICCISEGQLKRTHCVLDLDYFSTSFHTHDATMRCDDYPDLNNMLVTGN